MNSAVVFPPPTASLAFSTLPTSVIAPSLVSPNPTPNPTPLALPTLAVTPSPGIVIRGYVLHEDGRAVADVSIYLGLASYRGSVVATTNPDGYYQSDYIYIPGDEMLNVQAELPVYVFICTGPSWYDDPGLYYWRHYYGFEDKILDFIAKPIP